MTGAAGGFGDLLPLTTDDVWSELGLSPTSDRDAVRRAYSRRLRQTHPEDDAEGFKRLRDAYEAVIDWLDASGPVKSYASSVPSPPQAEGLVAHWGRLDALTGKARRGDAGENDLRADLQALLRAPALDDLEVFQETGLRLARVLVDISPNGDALVHPVAAHFGWTRRSDWDGAPEVMRLQGLAQTVTDRDLLRRSRAYAWLTSSPPTRRTKRAARWDRDGVKQLMKAADRSETWLLKEFHPASIRWWTKYLDADGRGARTRQTIIQYACRAALVAITLVLLRGLAIALA